MINEFFFFLESMQGFNSNKLNNICVVLQYLVETFAKLMIFIDFWQFHYPIS